MAASRFELPGDGVLAARLCLAQRMPAGDPLLLRSAARRSGACAENLRRTAATLLDTVDTALWSGAAHRAFTDQIRAHAPSMSATAERYEHYASALNAYAGALDEAAPRLAATRRLLAQRCAELAPWEHAAVGFGTTFPANLAVSPSAPGAELLPLARDFKAGYDRWADALDRCLLALRQADEADPTHDRHGLSAFQHHLTAAVRGQLSAFERAMLHPSLHNLSDCLGVLNVDLSVLGLALLFIWPPAGTACLVAASVLAAAQLAVDATRRAQGEQISNTSLGLELAAAIPIGGGAMRALRATDNVTHLVPGGGLAAHEGLDGGHTLAKHVGKSEDFLRHRLATEPDITGASTFYNRQVAENSISEVLSTHDKDIQYWLAGPKGKLVISSPTSGACGSVIGAAGTDPIESSVIRVVLRRSDALGLGYRIDTAMVIM